MADTRQKIEAALDMVAALCEPRGSAGAREWIMSIPARPDYDPDLVIGDALCAARAEIASLQSGIDRRTSELMARNNQLLEQKRAAESDLLLEREVRILLEDRLRRIAGLFNGHLEARVDDWVRSRIGDIEMHPRELAMRLLEEAIELAQAEGITAEQVARQAGHVFARETGEPLQEAAGVAVTLFGYCAARAILLVDIATEEIRRIEAKPLHEIRGSMARKADADLVTTVGR